MNACISCPACGAKIEIAAKEVQTELPLGPMEMARPRAVRDEGVAAPNFSEKKKLDGFEPSQIKSNGSVERLKTSARNESNRIESSIASCEEDLIESVKAIVGEKEFELNGRLWNFYFQHSRKALAYAIEDWKLRTPDQQRLIKNRPAWLTDRYKRAHHEMKARKSAAG